MNIKINFLVYYVHVLKMVCHKIIFILEFIKMIVITKIHTLVLESKNTYVKQVGYCTSNVLLIVRCKNLQRS